MKRYNLKCPYCVPEDSDVFMSASDPQALMCRTCDNEIDLAEAKEIAEGWNDFFADLEKMIKNEAGKDS